jgi:hypothetical protein
MGKACNLWVTQHQQELRWWRGQRTGGRCRSQSHEHIDPKQIARHSWHAAPAVEGAPTFRSSHCAALRPWQRRSLQVPLRCWACQGEGVGEVVGGQGGGGGQFPVAIPRTDRPQADCQSRWNNICFECSDGVATLSWMTRLPARSTDCSSYKSSGKYASAADLPRAVVARIEALGSPPSPPSSLLPVAAASEVELVAPACTCCSLFALTPHS